MGIAEVETLFGTVGLYMNRTISKTKLLQYQDRYRRVNEQEKVELRRTPLSVKLAQVATLMASVPWLGWEEALAAEDRAVWMRWQKLRAHYRKLLVNKKKARKKKK
jgi:hypothetical protein